MSVCDIYLPTYNLYICILIFAQYMNVYKIKNK